MWVTKRNWRSALSVALVNIPLSISLAIASGGSPMQGCTTAIFSGLVAGFVGGSPYNIFGPAGALTSILNACELDPLSDRCRLCTRQLRA